MAKASPELQAFAKKLEAAIEAARDCGNHDLVGMLTRELSDLRALCERHDVWFDESAAVAKEAK